VPEITLFVNDGYGWTCKVCRDEAAAVASPDESSLPRFFREGEAEEREPRLSTPALARWKDKKQRTLECPRCGVEEKLSE